MLRPAYLRHVAEQGQLWSLDQLSVPSFAGMGPEGALLAYVQSYAFIEHLARTEGERSVRDFVSAVIRKGDVERAARRTFRTDLGRLEARLHAELLAGGP